VLRVSPLVRFRWRSGGALAVGVGSFVMGEEALGEVSLSGGVVRVRAMARLPVATDEEYSSSRSSVNSRAL
jgi:hypothetical protein